MRQHVTAPPAAIPPWSFEDAKTRFPVEPDDFLEYSRANAMIHTLPLLLALALPPSVPHVTPESVTIAHAVQRAHAGGAIVTSVLVSGNDAVVRGRDRGPIHQGLIRRNGRWQIVCTLRAGAASAAQLERACGFPAASARQLAGDEAVNAAAAGGDFTRAQRLEQATFAVAGPAMRPAEAARLQLLRRLADQLRMGMITRQQAISQWNQVRISVFLP